MHRQEQQTIYFIQLTKVHLEALDAIVLLLSFLLSDTRGSVESFVLQLLEECNEVALKLASIIISNCFLPVFLEIFIVWGVLNVERTARFAMASHKHIAVASQVEEKNQVVEDIVVWLEKGRLEALSLSMSSKSSKDC